MGDIFKMSVKEIDRIPTIKKLSEGEITAGKAAYTLGLSVRHVRRLKKRFSKEGPRGLVHKSRGKVSKRKISDEKAKKIMNLIKTYYWDFGPTFASEKLNEDHGIQINRETLRGLMIKEGLWKVKKRKHFSLHQQRERRSREGELVQMDGSPHAWFEDRAGKCSLLLSVDDATSKVKEALFVKAETTNGYFVLVRNYITHHGKPVSLYVDKHSIFKTSNNKVNPEKLTQFTRAMKELSIEVICADSPQAKGRVENKNGTLQDRLVKEMRLRGISSIEEGNKYLPEFIEKFNKKFAVKAKDKEDAHRPLLPSENLDMILVKKYKRTLSKNLEFQFENKLYQIKTERPLYTMRNAPILVTKNTKGKVTVYYKEKKLDYKVLTREKRQTVADSKDINHKVDTVIKKARKPGKYHPWRYFTI